MAVPSACESPATLQMCTTVPSPPTRVSYLMAFPRGTPDVVGGSSCLIHVRKKLGIWDPLPCKLRGRVDAGDADARLRGDVPGGGLLFQ